MSNKAKPPVQMDVAKLAGVSSATVSRVLNHSTLVKPEIKARVEQAMRELNYMPNDAARSLASRKSRTLGAIIPTLNNAIFAEGINAFERVARALNYTLLLSVSNYDLDEEENIVRKMVQKGVDGLMLIGNDHHASTFELLRNSGLQHVCVWAYQEDSKVPNIGFSNTDAMAVLVDHLVETGHKEIAMLSGVTKSNDRARERLMGAKQRMKYYALQLTDDRVIEVPYSIRAARTAFSQIMETSPSAILCGNDVIAFGAVLEAQSRGMQIPSEIAITGFDNLPLSAELSPAITTIDVLADEMGAFSANALIAAIERETAVEPRCFSTKLIVRQTTAKPQ
ncbi:MAG: LacI family DNA-binding transcriptional regulator [Gammaproteobacteria bacterium]|nr:LacI family DNA-binding transcriptional regulator [Gammaproteobacteria bacterium]